MAETLQDLEVQAVARMRECARCNFAGDESEFVALGVETNGDVILTHRDHAGDPGMVLVCTGCGSQVGRLLPSVIRAALLRSLGGDL